MIIHINQKRLNLTAICLALLLHGCVTGSATSVKVDIAIQNVTVIDAVDGSRDNKTVLIKDSKIVHVIDSSAMNYLAEQAFEAEGKYLIPGLWDAHVHLCYDSEMAGSMPRLFIANGVTSVRDTGGDTACVLDAREKLKTLLAPSIYIAGPLLDGEPTVYAEPLNGFPGIGRTITTPEQAITEVDRLAAAGVDFIKAYEMLSPQTFRAILGQAKKHNLPVTGHVPLSMTTVDAARAGLNSIEHMRNLQMDCVADSEVMLEQRQAMLLNPENKTGAKLRSEIHSAQHFPAVQAYNADHCATLLTELAHYDTWQVPTMTLNMLFKTPYYGDPEWQETFDYLPVEVAASWRQRGSAIAKRLTAPSPTRDQRLKVSEWQIQLLGQIVEAGIPIMAGTDTPLLYLTPGFSLHRELHTLVTYGLSPLQAIEAATLTPAKYFNLGNTQGSIAAGKLADLVLLDADPLADIKNTTKINAVIKAGTLIDRTKLDQLLDSVNQDQIKQPEPVEIK